ncbi:unnamed protein product [Aureobasidium mustum]|uniref:Uncharacterized protein n=1 Tax=Aureobasidium mustum TaxID=2773714 RepID=A0A9N8PJF8_9PEZI|nr:unnamed protein product [Aureobasidium mustum]
MALQARSTSNPPSRYPFQQDADEPRYLTTEDLESFRINLVKTREMTAVIEAAFQQLNTQIHSINTSGPVSTTIDPIKREIRKCKEVVDSAMETARTQEEASRVLIEQGRFGDALTAINEGLIVIGELKKPLIGIRDQLKNLSSKGRTIVTESLRQMGFDKEVEAWDTSVTEWTGRMVLPTWKL